MQILCEQNAFKNHTQIFVHVHLNNQQTDTHTHTQTRTVHNRCTLRYTLTTNNIVLQNVGSTYFLWELKREHAGHGNQQWKTPDDPDKQFLRHFDWGWMSWKNVKNVSKRIPPCLPCSRVSNEWSLLASLWRLKWIPDKKYFLGHLTYRMPCEKPCSCYRLLFVVYSTCFSCEMFSFHFSVWLFRFWK